MKVLAEVKPTSEQLPIISNPRAGVTLIRGSAGSGKTTTALLMLRQYSVFWISRHQRMGIDHKVRILVLTFNRTLRGYIKELVEKQTKNVITHVEIFTFGKWAMKNLLANVLKDSDRKNGSYWVLRTCYRLQQSV